MTYYTGYRGRFQPQAQDLAFIKDKDGNKFRLFQEIAIHWKRIARILELTPSHITRIQHIQRSGYDYSDCVEEVFQVWFCNASVLPKSEEYPLSWYGLAQLLNTAGLSPVAKEYFKVLDNCT